MVKTKAQKPRENNEMPEEIDFSGGVRGRFIAAGANLNLPVYLDREVQAYLETIARQRGVGVSQVANDMLRRDIAVLDGAQPA